MSEILNIAAALTVWARDLESRNAQTGDPEYALDAEQLYLLSAYFYRLSDVYPYIPTLDEVTTAGNVTINDITVGSINTTLSFGITPNVVYYNTGTGQLTYGPASGLSPGLYAQTADSIPVTNTIVQTTLIDGGVGTLSIPANGFQVGASFIAYFSGKISCINNEKIEIRSKAGSIVLADTGLITLAAATNKNWELYINFTVRSIGAAGVASIATSGRFSYNKDASNSPESIGFYNLNNTTFDTTISNTLDVTVQWNSANPLNSIYTDMFNLYRIY
jgi:hypothetical protein